MLLWILSFSARAAGDPKAEITDIEHKARAASTTDELMAFYDPNEIITYDYIPELRYVGAKAVHADIDHFFSNTEDLRGNFVDLKVYTDGPPSAPLAKREIVDSFDTAAECRHWVIAAR